MNHYLNVLKKYADFSGRASRAEYWVFLLVNIVAVFVLGMIHSVLMMLYMLAVTIPMLAVAVRRLHDIGKSGWMFLLSFIPFVNFVVIFWLFSEGQAGSNEFGANPNEAGVMQAQPQAPVVPPTPPSMTSTPSQM